MDEPIDIPALTAPIGDGPSPVGEDLRLAVDASNFFTLKDLRAEARTAEREAAASPEGDTPVLEAGAAKWGELVALASDLLAGQTKDLEIASWLCEGATRLDGFRGLADGLALVDQLLQRYWDDGVFPSEDEDGVETRIAPVGGLLGMSGAAALLQPIKLLPLSDRDRDVALWSLANAQAPLTGGDDANARERAAAKRSERLEQIRQAVRRSSPAFLRATYVQIKAALATIASLVATVDRVAQTGPFGAQVVEPLQAALAFYEEQVKDLLVDATPATPAATVEAGGGGATEPTAAAVAPVGWVAGREQAYASIIGVAEFFEASEPHSLVARGLREVVRRGRMSLEDLLLELIPEADQRTLFLQRAGIRSDPSAQEDAY